MQTAHIKAIGIDEIHVGREMKNEQFLLKIITMDMANAYYSWISENFPKAHIVFDHFHVIKLMNDKLDQVR